MRRAASSIAVASLILAPREALAVDLPKVDGSPVSLDVTETAIVAQRFDARAGEAPDDQGYFSFLNRLNSVLTWKKWTVGLRLDSSVYELRPEDRDFPNTAQGVQDHRNAIIDGATRYPTRIIYPAKGWVTYRSGILEATIGDSYVTLGRGLVLSVRKVDELGIDTTILGGKVTLQQDPFAVTVVAGLANPARIDEPTGRSLFLPTALPSTIDPNGPQPVFGSDRIIGAQIQTGRGLPVTLSTQVAYLKKCAPYRYASDSREVNTDFLDAPIGTCDDDSVEKFIGTLPDHISPILKSHENVNASESLEVPSLWGHGNFYVEAAVQKHDPYADNKNTTEGNALYGSFVASGGPLTNTLEMKAYRNYFPLLASVNTTRASAFNALAYSTPPTGEVITEDSEFNNFNTCVVGGRDRLDYNVNDDVLLWGALGYFVTRGESPGAQCDQFGAATVDRDKTTNDVVDVAGGAVIHFDHEKSTAFVQAKLRNDQTEANTAYYREYAVQYSVTKYISGPWSVELSGRHRHRQEDGYNLRLGQAGGAPWVEGEEYLAAKVAPKWIFGPGFEYTTYVGLPTYYFNGSILYKFTSQSNVRLYVGQNRGGLRCTNGICRFLPAFSGARVELTLRF